jgi:hypothetical protein
MPSICLSCIIYTIHDRKVEENKYIGIFLLWLSQLIKVGGLGKDDSLHMYIDKRTVEYLFKDSIFGSLLGKATFQTQIFGVEPPKTHLEGMMWKYILSDYMQNVYMYIDIDILILKPLKGFLDSVVPNKIYVCIEGNLIDSDYGADIISEEFKKGRPGFSAGKFIIYGKDLRDSLFGTVQAICNHTKNYYTVEQPFFNRALLDMENIDVKLLQGPIVSLNKIDYNKDVTILFDCAGEPGNGETHYSKIHDIFCLLNCDAL